MNSLQSTCVTHEPHIVNLQFHAGCTLRALLLLDATHPSAAAVNNLLRVCRQRVSGFNVVHG